MPFLSTYFLGLYQGLLSIHL